MKKICSGLLIVLLLLAAPITALALESAGCRITADTMTALPGDTVTVPVRIRDNPGFTNFAITVNYDTAALQLESIDTVGTEAQPYLCPAAAAVNTAYTAEDGGSPCAFVTAAASESVAGDGVLFALRFTVLSERTGTVEIEPEIRYLRCADALSSVFTALTASVEKGAVEVAVKGDVDADGSITEADAAFVYDYINEAGTLSDRERAAADVNGDGMVDTTDAALLYRFVHQTLTDFPKSITEEVIE